MNGLVALHAQHMNRHLDHVFQNRTVWPQVEVLENHAEVSANTLNLATVCDFKTAMAGVLHAIGFTLDSYLARGRVLQQINAAK